MKKFLKLLVIFILILSVTGCMKFNYFISINKDKSMDLEIIIAADKRFSEAENGIDFTDIDSDKLSENGYLVGAYNEDSYEGSRIIKSFKNIDDISTTDDNDLVIDLKNALNGTDNTLFYVKKSFFKNTYIGRFMMTDTEDFEEQLGSSSSIEEEDELAGEEVVDNEFVIVEDSIKELEDAMSEMSKVLDIKFIINVPYKTLSNNATSVSENQKTLTWNLLEIKEKNVEFEFYLYNFENIITCVAALLIIIIILVVIIKKSTKKKKKNNLVNNDTIINNSDNDNITTTKEFIDQINPNNPSLSFINNNNEEVKVENKSSFIKNIEYDDEVSNQTTQNSNCIDINNQINSIQNILNIDSNQDNNKNN